MKANWFNRHTLGGLALGMVISVLPMFGYLLFPNVCLYALVAFFKQLRTHDVWTYYFQQAIAAVGVVVIAMLLPVKHLDGKVGPMSYPAMPLEELRKKLYADWHVRVHVFDKALAQKNLAFAIDEPLTRREVLHRLAQASETELHIGYCGTGATFLWGAHPSFTTLRKKSVTSPESAKEK